MPNATTNLTGMMTKRMLFDALHSAFEDGSITKFGNNAIVPGVDGVSFEFNIETLLHTIDAYYQRPPSEGD